MIQDIKYIFSICKGKMWFFLILMIFSTTNFNIYVTTIFSLFMLFSISWKKYVNKEFIVLLFFSISYSLVLWAKGFLYFRVFMFCLFIAPIMFYSFGRYVVGRMRNPNLIVAFLALFTFLFSINLYVSTLIDIQKNGFIDFFREVSLIGYEVKNEANALAATLLGLVASLGLVGLSIFVYCSNNLNLDVRCVFVVLFLFSLLTVVHLINRTGLVVFLLSFLGVTLYNIKRRFWKVLGICIWGILFVCFIYFFDLINLEEIVNAYSARELNGAKIGEAGGRIKRWTDAIAFLVENPYGYHSLKTYVPYAHNMWLDVGRVAGFFVMVLLLLATILSSITLLKLLKQKDTFLSSIFLAYNIVFFLSCMVEPVIEGFPLYFFFYVMLWGMQREYLHVISDKKVLFIKRFGKR